MLKKQPPTTHKMGCYLHEQKYNSKYESVVIRILSKVHEKESKKMMH